MSTAELVLPEMSEAEAKALTEKIRRAGDRLWELLTEAHDGKAWKAMGYRSFRDYVGSEFSMNRSHAYRLLAHGRVIAALREAGEVSPDGDIPEGTTRRLAAEQRAATQPEPHPPTDGDRSTNPAPEVPPAPSSPSPDEEVIANADGQPRGEPDEPPHDTPPAAEPSEPGVAGAPSLIPSAGSATVTIHGASTGSNADAPQVWFPPPNLCTDPAHADLLSLLRDLDRLLLPRDEEDWRAWDLGDDEAAGRALMVKVRGLLGEAPPVQTEPEAEGAASIIQRWDDAARAENDTAEAADERTVAIRRHLARMAAKDRARFLRAHRITDLELWLDGLDGDELDSALRLLGLVGAETA